MRTLLLGNSFPSVHIETAREISSQGIRLKDQEFMNVMRRGIARTCEG